MNVIKQIRKFFNILSYEESKLINKQYDDLKKIAERLASEHNDSEYEYEREKDNTCPLCRGKEVVNKITRVEGSGYVSGSFAFGTGSVYGSSKTDTNEVNNCNKCGNQWKKYKVKYKLYDDIFSKLMDCVSDKIEGKDRWYEREKYLEILKDTYAEVLWKIFKEVEDDCYSSTRETITPDSLRTIFKSVYE